MYRQTRNPAAGADAPFVRDHRRVIEVVGEGEAAAPPDQADVVLGAVTEETSLHQAQSRNTADVSRIIQALRQLGIPPENMQTVAYRIEPQYRYEDGKPIFLGYRVTHLLQITVRDMNRTGLIVDAAVASGANSVTNIRFSVSQPAVYYDRALSLAVADARRKASVIARSLGVAVQDIPFHVEEQTRAPEPSPLLAVAYESPAAAAPVQPGEIRIRAAVKAEFAY